MKISYKNSEAGSDSVREVRDTGAHVQTSWRVAAAGCKKCGAREALRPATDFLDTIIIVIIIHRAVTLDCVNEVGAVKSLSVILR